MSTAVLISLDAELARRLRILADASNRPLVVVNDCEGLRALEELVPGHVIVDLNVGEDAIRCIENIRANKQPLSIIAFLDHYVGRLPVRAKLAGADRVVPASQLEHEFAGLLSD